MNDLAWFVVGVLAGGLLGYAGVILYACRTAEWPPCGEPEEEAQGD